MARGLTHFLLFGFLIVTGVALSANRLAAAPQEAPNSPSSFPNSAQNSAAPSALSPTLPTQEELRAEARVLVANQHKNDNELEEYERIERHITRTSGSSSHTVDDETYRVVPTGGGTMKIALKQGNAPVDPAVYRKQLEAWANLLQMMVRPGDTKATTAYDKYRKRQQDRAQIVDTMIVAFLIKPLPPEVLNGHRCDVFELSPSPEFHPHSLLEEALTHVTARMWVDREAVQLVRGEARVISDFSIGGGLIGKLYHGGAFSMEQTEVSPGVWLPFHYQYDFMGRKFLFPFEEHETIEASHYHRLGPPKDALTLVENELATRKPFGQEP